MSVRRIGVLTRHNLLLVGREPGPLISRIAMPIVVMLVLRPLYASALGSRERGTVQSVVGMLVMFSLLGMSVVGGAVLTERTWRTMDRLRATRASAAELLVGKAVPVLLLVLAQQVVVLGMGVGVLGLRVPDPALLAGCVLAWSVTLLCCGSAIATLVRSQAELSAATDVGGLICTVLAGALVPLSGMPGWARHAAPASPGYWAMRGLSAALTGQRGAALLSVAVLTGVAVLGASVAGYRMARGWGRAF
jgi:ABC-2 type transport system permease protein